jgi:chromodomain-helicase-DNA-binding protein 1
VTLGLFVVDELKSLTIKGIKKVDNFIKRRRERDQAIQFWTPEEQERAALEMEEELLLKARHKVVERIIGVQRVMGDQGVAETEYLCKWEGLPYNDANWELTADISFL